MPEEIEDASFTDDKIEVDEVDLDLDEHGKSVKALEKQKKRTKRGKDKEETADESEEEASDEEVSEED